MAAAGLLKSWCAWSFACVVAALPAAAPAVVFDNGAVNTVDSAVGASLVRNSVGGLPTTVNAVAGASFVGGLGVQDTSVANFFAGATATSVDARDQSTVTIHGGAFDMVDASDSAAVWIHGGSFTRGNNTLRIFHDAAVTISGGSFTVASGNMVVVLDDAAVTIRGGSFTGGRIYAGEVGGRATVDIHGGNFTEQVGEGLAQIINVHDSVTTIHGRSFNLPFGVITGDFDGVLSGVLANGDAIEVNLQNVVSTANTGRIVLVQSPIPEPGAAWLLAAGLGLGLLLRGRGSPPKQLRLRQ